LPANLAARHVPVPFFGLFGACSTFSEALGLAGIALDGGFCVESGWLVLRPTIRLRNDSFGIRQNWAFNVNRLHHWTVTGAAATIIGESGSGAALTGITVGTGNRHGSERHK